MIVITDDVLFKSITALVLSRLIIVKTLSWSQLF